MYVNQAHSVSQALHNGLHAIRVGGIKKPSRVGDVLVSQRPVMTVYEEPTNRVLFSPMRDANPFFHVMETLWMLAGRNDLPWLTRFNKQFASYSDDGGQTQPGAYGYRWRNYFGHDQLQDIILELKQSPDSRRVVLTMWDGGARGTWDNAERPGVCDKSPDYQPGDFYAAVSGSADVPCNTHAYFDTIDGKLNMTVCCRSNDIIWGAYGANAVHFSFLLEYISIATGIPMGVYRQFSNNFHLYTNVVDENQIMPLARDVIESDIYYKRRGVHDLTLRRADPPIRKVSLMMEQEEFDIQLYAFMDETGPRKSIDASDYTEPFFATVAIPMFNAYMFFKNKNYDAAIDLVSLIRAEDWRKACIDWLQRRKIKHELNAKPFTAVVEPATDTTEGFGDFVQQEKPNA